MVSSDGWATEPRDKRGRLPIVASDLGGPMCAINWKFGPLILCDGKEGHPPPHRHYSAAGRAEWQDDTACDAVTAYEFAAKWAG